MLKAPKFWYKKNDTYLSNSLYPLSLLFRFGTKIRNVISRKWIVGIIEKWVLEIKKPKNYLTTM